MSSASTTSTVYPMSDESKQDSYMNSSSPPASSTALESIDPFEHSLSAATFLDSDLGNRGLSPASSVHSSSYPDNRVSYQEYMMMNLMAYGLPTAEANPPSTAAQMPPYPNTTPVITLGTEEDHPENLRQTYRGNIAEALNRPDHRGPDLYFQFQAIKDWSGACSTALSSEDVPSPNSSMPQEAQYMSTSTSVDDHANQPVLPVACSAHDWSTKNKLNLTVNTNMTAFDVTDRLSPSCQNPPTPYSDCSTSYVSPSAASFDFQPQHPAQLMSNPPSIISWLHGSLNAPQSNTSRNYYDGVPTPSSVTFSAVPTPTGTCFPSDYAHFPQKENHALGDNANSGSFLHQLPAPSSALHSPSNLDLTSGLGYLPLTGAVYQVSFSHLEGTGNQFINSPASYFCSLDGGAEDFSGLHQAPPITPSDVNHPNISELSSRKNSVISSPDASMFGHMTSDPEFDQRVEQASDNSDHCASLTDGANVPTSLGSSEYHHCAEKGKRARSQETDSDDERVIYKRRCSATSDDSTHENINPYPTGDASLLPKRAPLVGPRLKPGPKSRRTVIQHPPPAAKVIGLNLCQQDIGITKDFLKSLYEIISSPDETAKRYFCKIEDCGRSFARKTAVETHLQTHLEDKPFVCSFPDCNAAFVRPHDHRRHIQIHSKSKSFSCVCGKSFARGDALVRHRHRGICEGSLVPMIEK